MAREYERNVSDLTPMLRDSLEFIEFVTKALPAFALPLMPSDLTPVVIFTDAEGKKRTKTKEPSGHLGLVEYTTPCSGNAMRTPPPQMNG